MVSQYVSCGFMGEGCRTNGCLSESLHFWAACDLKLFSNWFLKDSPRCVPGESEFDTCYFIQSDWFSSPVIQLYALGPLLRVRRRLRQNLARLITFVEIMAAVKPHSVADLQKSPFTRRSLEEKKRISDSNPAKTRFTNPAAAASGQCQRTKLTLHPQLTRACHEKRRDVMLAMPFSAFPVFYFKVSARFVDNNGVFAGLTGKLSVRIKSIFDVLANISFDVLPSLQFILLFFSFGSSAGLMIVAVLPVLTTVTRYNWDITCGQRMGCSGPVRRSVYLIFMLVINAGLVYFYSTALENEKDRVGWVCVILFLQSLWTVINFTWSFTEYALLRVVPVYVFGSVGVVLLNAVALMTELILKTVNGEGGVGDMRIIVFSSEFIFTLFLMILMIFEPWIKPCLESCQKAIKSRRARAAGSQNQESQNAVGSDETTASGSNQNQNPAESHEMKALLEKDQDTSRNEDQPDSVVSQT